MSDSYPSNLYGIQSPVPWMIPEPPAMYCLVTGSRDWHDESVIKEDLQRLPKHCVVLHGGCRTGADAIADRLAKILGLRVMQFDADWSKGKKAGPIRNGVMCKYLADKISAGAEYVAFSYYSGDHSIGTIDCMNKLKARAIEFTRRNAR